MKKILILTVAIPTFSSAVQFTAELEVDKNANPEYQANIETVTEKAKYYDFIVTKSADIEVAPTNCRGVSLNKFSKLGMGEVLQLEADVTIRNKDANLIILESTGDKASWIWADMDIEGKKADVIFANPQGYLARIYNTTNIGDVSFIKSAIKLDPEGRFVNQENYATNQGFYTKQQYANGHMANYNWGPNLQYVVAGANFEYENSNLNNFDQVVRFKLDRNGNIYQR